MMAARPGRGFLHIALIVFQGVFTFGVLYCLDH